MTSLTFLNAYLCANALLVFAALGVGGLRRFGSRTCGSGTFRQLLLSSYVIAGAALVLPLVNALSSPGPIVPHTAQVWSAPTMHESARRVPGENQEALSFAPETPSVSLGGFVLAVGIAFATGALIMLARLVLDAFATFRLIGRAHTVRRLGKLRVLASDTAIIPFSFWVPGRAYIVIPSDLILCPADLRMILKHEGQHHRQADTRIVYGAQLLRCFFFWNPAVHSLVRQIVELQELACDEAVLSGQGVRAPDYCDCLLRLAQSALDGRQTRRWMSMTGSNRGALARRVDAAMKRDGASYRENLSNRQGVSSARSFAALVGAAGVILLTALSVAFAAPIADRRISGSDARRMALAAGQQGAFPIAVNESVIEQLNLLAGTPDGRAWLRESVARMSQYETYIAEKIRVAGLPPELIAVPLVESGYRNLPAAPNPRRGAGLWMFIAPTARRFGLEVTAQEDQRLDVARETEAAMQLLTDLHQQFGDWGLALLAYNAGSAKVEDGIRATGSRDVWQLIEHGYENDPAYVPRLVAAMILLANPAALD